MFKTRLKILGQIANWKKSIIISLMVTSIAIYTIDGWFGIRALIVFLANWFSLIFLFISNNISNDLPSNRLDITNTTSVKLLSKSEAYLLLFVFASFTICLYLMIAVYIEDYWIILNSFLLLLLGYFYTSKPFKLKSIRFIGKFVYAYTLGIAQYISTILSFKLVSNSNIIILISVLLIYFLLTIKFKNFYE